MELQIQLRKVKEEQAEFERMRARERHEDTLKNLEKKEFDAERKKRLQADKYIDNKEMQRVIKEQKREEKWVQKELLRERHEETVKNLEKKEYDKEKQRRLDEDKYLDNMEL